MCCRIVLLVLMTLLVPRWAPAAAPETGPVTPRPEMEKAAYLGIATTQTLPDRRKTLGLPHGVGLTVQHVYAGSPGEAAGLRQNDVLHKINDQLLVNNPQFLVLVRTFQPGDQIKLTVLRGAAPIEVQIRLGEKEVPARAAKDGRYYWTLRTVQGRIDIVAVPVTFSSRYEDERYVLELSTGAQGRFFRAKDKKGEVLFHGPVDTPAERKAVPENLRPGLELLEKPPPAKSPLPPVGAATAPASS